MRKYGRLAAASLAVLLLVTSCGQAGGPDHPEGPALVLAGDGKVTAYLVGEFDKDYYSLDELETMAKEEAAAFGGAGEGGAAPVSVEKVEAYADGSGRVIVTYGFDSTGSYEAFIGGQLFYGTVSEALLQGFARDVVLKSVSGDTQMNADELSQQSGLHLIVTDVSAVIYCPEKVTHVSAGAVLNQDGSVDVSQAGGTVYILLRK